MKTLKELEDYVKCNSVKCTKNKYGKNLYNMELSIFKEIEFMENVWTEYICCEETTIGKYI